MLQSGDFFLLCSRFRHYLRLWSLVTWSIHVFLWGEKSFICMGNWTRHGSFLVQSSHYFIFYFLLKTGIESWIVDFPKFTSMYISLDLSFSQVSVLFVWFWFDLKNNCLLSFKFTFWGAALHGNHYHSLLRIIMWFFWWVDVAVTYFFRITSGNKASPWFGDLPSYCLRLVVFCWSSRQVLFTGNWLLD